jgi:hypothetical protein
MKSLSSKEILSYLDTIVLIGLGHPLYKGLGEDGP